MSFEYASSMSTIFPVDPHPTSQTRYSERIEVIAQPCYTSKLRYRSDFTTNKNRRGVLQSQNNPNYRSPAIRIPQEYLNVTRSYYVRICLVTIINEQTHCRYIHPHELEDVNMNVYNDQQNNAVWYPIEESDRDGIKSFSNLRIVKKTEGDLKSHGDLRLFDSPNLPSTPQLSSPKDTIKEYNLDRLQLAFTLGEKTIIDGNPTYISFASTTVYSDELIEISGRRSDTNNPTTEPTSSKSQKSRSSTCSIYKYAPRKGDIESNDEVLVFFSSSLRSSKYGELQVSFEYDTPFNHWSAPVVDLEVKDQMVSFRTPRFPISIDRCTTVDIVLKQKRRSFEPLKFDYIPSVVCSQCQGNANPVRQVNPNKRPISDVYTEEADTVESTNANNAELNTSFSPDAFDPACELLSSEDASQQILDKLADGIASLFSNKDLLPVLRICRPFIRKRPELLHASIDNDHSELVSSFVAVAGMKLLQHKNQEGETVLLHAARLNRITIVQAVLKRKEFEKLLQDTNHKGQNVFHVLALNVDSDEILQLIINHFVDKSITIQQTFDQVDEDNRIPLELAILNDNLPALNHFFTYFQVSNDFIKNDHHNL